MIVLVLVEKWEFRELSRTKRRDIKFRRTKLTAPFIHTGRDQVMQDLSPGTAHVRVCTHSWAEGCLSHKQA